MNLREGHRSLWLAKAKAQRPTRHIQQRALVHKSTQSWKLDKFPGVFVCADNLLSNLLLDKSRLEIL